MLFQNINKRKTIISTTFLFALSLSIVVISILNHMKHLSMLPDVFLYLIQGLRFAGYNNFSFTSYTPINSPLIPFLTSLLFRLGFIGKTTIFVVTGIFYIIGVLYSYFLFKLRFDNKYALFGSILYACFFSNVSWVAIGTLDVPSVALSIMTIYYLILGVNKNQKYIYLSFILFALAFLTKYSAILILPLMILYPLFKGDFKVIKKYFKSYVVGGLLAVAINIPFVLYLLSIGLFDNALNPFIRMGSGTSGWAGNITSSLTKNDKLFYITHLDKFIAVDNFNFIAILLIIISIIGFIIIFYKNKHLFNKISKNKNLGLLIIGIILLILGFLSVEYISNLINIGLISLGILSIAIFINYLLSIEYNEKSIFNFNFDILMVYWFLIYLIFFSAILPRLERYSIPLLLPLAFFIALGFKAFLETSFIYNLNNRFNLDFSKIIPLIFTIILIFSAVNVADTNHVGYQTELTADLCHYLEEYDPDFHSNKIWSLYGGVSSFYSKSNIHLVQFPVESGKLNQDKFTSLGNEMYNEDVDYFISYVNKYDIPHYKILKKTRKGAIYVKED